jgi:hypothetical protein
MRYQSDHACKDQELRGGGEPSECRHDSLEEFAEGYEDLDTRYRGHRRSHRQADTHRAGQGIAPQGRIHRIPDIHRDKDERSVGFVKMGVARVDTAHGKIVQCVEVCGVVRIGEATSGTFSSRMEVNVFAKPSPFSFYVCDRALGSEGQPFRVFANFIFEMMGRIGDEYATCERFLQRRTNLRAGTILEPPLQLAMNNVRVDHDGELQQLREHRPRCREDFEDLPELGEHIGAQDLLDFRRSGLLFVSHRFDFDLLASSGNDRTSGLLY